MFDPAEYDRPVRAWVRLCGVPGPYCVRRPTPKAPLRLEVLTCTRPERHDGDFHQHATESEGVIATWGRDGKPISPKPLKGV